MRSIREIVRSNPANVCRIGAVLLFFNLFNSVVCPADNTSRDTLAVIGQNVITVNSFLESYRAKLRETGLQDNIEIRQKYLDNLIADELLIEEAGRRGLHKTSEALDERRRIETQELLNAFSEKHISPKIKVTEDDLRKLFVQLNTKIKVSHLYAATKCEADSLYNRLMNGERFEQLAYQIFDDPQLKSGGGSLGYITVDEMDRAFEKAAYSMQPGEISEPVKTVKGYSIIRVEDIKGNPLISESEYLKAHDNLIRFARKRAYEDASVHYAHSISEKLNLIFRTESISKLYDMLMNRSLQEFIETPSLISDSDLDKQVVSSGLGRWTIADVIAAMNKVPPKQRRWITTKENLQNFITGLVNREYIISQSLKEKLNATESFRKNVAFNFDSYLLQTIEEELRRDIQISNDEIWSHYNENLRDFTTSPKVRLSLILLDNKSVADSVSALLKSGADFGKLAEDYSIQRLTAANKGDAGFFEQKNLDYLGEDVFKLNIGEWSGPFVDEDKFVFIKCTEKEDTRLKTLDEVKEQIEESLSSIKWFDRRKNCVNELKNNRQVRTMHSKLSQLKL